MSINEQIEAAWEEQCEDFSKASEHRMFEVGYRAALRGLWRVIPEDEVKTGERYTIAVRPAGELLWRDYAMVSLSNYEIMVIEDPRKLILDPNPKERFDIADVELFLQPNFDNLPSPAEVFGEDLLRKTQAE